MATLEELKAKLTANQTAGDNAAASVDATLANQAAAAAAVPEDQERVFFGELPPAVTYLTPTGQPVFFYLGYHKTRDPEAIKICQDIKGVTEVTGQVAPEDVPVPPVRTRSRNWAAAEPTVVTPADLLAIAASRRVASTADLGGNTAESSSTV